MAVAIINNTSYDTLSEAIIAANSIDGDVTISLISDFEFSSALTIAKNITINGNHTIKRAKSYLGSFMTINAGSTLTLNDITINGNHNWSFDYDTYNEMLQSGEKASDASMFTTMETDAPVTTGIMFTIKGALIADGITIKNNLGKATLFSVQSGGVLTTSNSEFTHLHSSTNNVVASVLSGGTWNINEGTHIHGNHASGNGGISRGDGHIIMNGGLIENNTAANSNGTIFMFYGSGSLFTMNGGTIRCNSGVAGTSNGRNASIYLHSASSMVMNGGLIEVNTGFGAGGIDAPYTNRNSTLTIYGGSVINNVSISGSTEPDIRGTTSNTGITIYGGTFTQDVNEYCADGFSVQEQPDGSFSCVDHMYSLYAFVNGELKIVEAYTCINGVITKITEIGQCINGNITKL